MSRYTFTFAHLILLLLYFVVFLKFSSCYVLSCHVLFLFVSLHPYSFFLCSCFYKIIINDIMCPFCIGCQLTSIKYGSFILQVKHWHFVLMMTHFLDKFWRSKFFYHLIFDHQVEHLKKFGHHLNKNFNLCFKKFQSPPIKFQLSNWCELISTIDPTIEKIWSSFEKKIGCHLKCFVCLIDNGSISTIDPTTKFEPLFGHYWTLTIKCHFGYRKV